MANYSKTAKQYAVLFDMDGVICNTNPYHVKAYEILLQKHQISFSKTNFANQINGKHNSHILKYFFKRPLSKAALIDLEDEKELIFREIYKEKVEPITGFINLLNSIRQEGFKTGIATAAPKANMEIIIHSLKIEDKMDSLFACEDVVYHKPNPEIYLKSAKNLQVSKENVLIFEDSYSGVTAGLEAGMKVIGVLSSHQAQELPGCSLYINDFTEITTSDLFQLLSQ